MTSTLPPAFPMVAHALAPSAEKESDEPFISDNADFYKRTVTHHELLDDGEEKKLVTEMVERREEWRRVVFTHPLAWERASRLYTDANANGQKFLQIIEMLHGENRVEAWTEFRRWYPTIQRAIARGRDDREYMLLLFGKHPFRVGYVQEIMRGVEQVPLRRRQKLNGVATAQEVRTAFVVWQEKRKELILANARLVMHIAESYSLGSLDLMDLVEEGNIGLAMAADKFNPSLETGFATFATWWIRKYILKAMAREKKQKHRWLHGEHADDGYDSFTDPSAPSPPVTAGQREMSAEVARVLEVLSEKHRRFVEMRYGLKDGIERSLEEVGEALGVNRQRAQQLERVILNQLRNPDRHFLYPLAAHYADDHPHVGKPRRMESLMDTSADRRLQLDLLQLHIQIKIANILAKQEIYTVADYLALTEEDKKSIPKFGPAYRAMMEKKIAELQLPFLL